MRKFASGPMGGGGNTFVQILWVDVSGKGTHHALALYVRHELTLATLCSSAVVDEVLNKPRARLRKPWLRQASTAAHSEVTEPDSSWMYFLVTASSITCFTSFLTAAISFSLKSILSERFWFCHSGLRSWCRKKTGAVQTRVYVRYQ